MITRAQIWGFCENQINNGLSKYQNDNPVDLLHEEFTNSLNLKPSNPDYLECRYEIIKFYFANKKLFACPVE